MLNPSTADADIDDPTIRRCIRFATDWGFDVLSVRNLFALRATDPKQLLACDVLPSGGGRGDAEIAMANTADLVIAAWGAWVPHDRTRDARRFLASSKLHCLGTTKAGAPRHPLYVKAETKPVKYEWPD